MKDTTDFTALDTAIEKAIRDAAFAAAEELRKKKIRLYEKRVKALKSKPIKFAEKEFK